MKRFVQTFITLLIIAGIYLVWASFKPATVVLPVKAPLNATDIFDNHLFLTGIASASSLQTPSYTIKSLILPHHQIAAPLIATGVRLASLTQNPKVILLFGPNHLDTGPCEVQSSTNSWNTPFGQVDNDPALINDLVQKGLVCLNDTLIQEEHSISVPISYLKYYFPNSRVIILSLKNKLDNQKIIQLAEQINSHAEISLVVASIDFAHGVDSPTAQRNSDLIKAAIENDDEKNIQDLSSQFIDSPSSLLLLLNINRLRALKESHFLMQTDATEYLTIEPKLTTGYQLVAFAKETPSTDINLFFTGDVMLGRSIHSFYKKQIDPFWPFSPSIVKALTDADLSIINLESPFAENCTPTDSGMKFCAESSQIESLIHSGIDIANLANNHIGNQGLTGIQFTTNLLEKNNFGVIGLQKPFFKTVKNQKIAFVSFNDIPPFEPGVSKLSESFLVDQINQATASAKIVIAIFHWGVEYQSKPSSRQVRFAHLAIDSGASAVIGHHPHWVQSSETYKGKPIFYSLGNFIFDQFWSANTKKGLTVRLTISPFGKITTKEIPISISTTGEPSF